MRVLVGTSCVHPRVASIILALLRLGARRVWRKVELLLRLDEDEIERVLGETIDSILASARIPRALYERELENVDDPISYIQRHRWLYEKHLLRRRELEARSVLLSGEGIVTMLDSLASHGFSVYIAARHGGIVICTRYRPAPPGGGDDEVMLVFARMRRILRDVASGGTARFYVHGGKAIVIFEGPGSPAEKLREYDVLSSIISAEASNLV